MIFSDMTHINDSLVHDGCVVIDLLDAESISSLLDIYQTLVGPVCKGFYSTILSRDPKHREAVDNAIRSQLTPRVRSLLAGYRIAFCTFAVKNANSMKSTVPLHQDWSFVDEHQFISIGLWCPLVDVNLENGCLQVVKGSHASAHPPRAACTPFAYPELEERLRAKYLSSIPMSAGQAMLFDNRLFHCSPPNKSASERIAITAVIVPADCKLRYYHLVDPLQPHWIEVFEVEDSFYLTHMAPSRPLDAVSLGFLDTREFK
jgi:hypothetical protein